MMLPNSSCSCLVLEGDSVTKTKLVYQIDTQKQEAFAIARLIVSGNPLHRTITVTAVPGSDNPGQQIESASIHTHVVWELERRHSLSQEFVPTGLNVDGDPPHLCTDELTRADLAPPNEHGLLCGGCWIGRWEVDTPGFFDSEGWQYQSTSFLTLKRGQHAPSFAAQWSPEVTSATMVRRRRWQRTSLDHLDLSLIHISEPTRLLSISYAVFCLKKKKTARKHIHKLIYIQH
eukprot:TRINITY_DN20769_c0_g1_i1.p1 TRINITY_DN20769_c0_g1~~TRINITY_DN20769_c0_g1_i1.p1  ORF type:complete len:232 (+),score=31.30 TRINITY_DN20769_c0_g1_i1:308-1003(+)